ncbi:hypothetical protein LTR16_011846, partial [Cryomyces antarcticus]
ADADNGIQWEEWESTTEEESDTDVLYKLEEYLPAPLRKWVDHKLRDLRVLLIENGILAAPKNAADGSNTSEVKAVTSARNRLNAAQTELNNARNDLTTHRDDLTTDYGPSDVFRALKGQCISTDSGEYTYELCWLT